MTTERWRRLMSCEGLKLQPDEIAEGYHFCPDWDDLLVGPDMQESDTCTCDVPALSPRTEPDSTDRGAK
jgi:hypothetical protein